MPERSGLPSELGARASREEEEESIEDYMTRLLDRAGSGQSRPSEPLASPSTSRTEEDAVPTASPVSTDSAAQSSPPVVDPEEPRETAARAAGWKNSIDLSAMRELANLSARTAIDRHAKKMRWSTATGKLLVAFVGLAAGLVLIWIWWAKAPNPVTLCEAITGFFVALFWGIWSVFSGRRTSQAAAGPLPARSESPGGLDVVEVAEVVVDSDVVEHPAEPS